MASQNKEAHMSHEIVPGGPTREEAQELNKPKANSLVPKFSVLDKISLVLTGLGIGALGNTALEAQNQTQKPPQVTPDQRGPNLPPEGVHLDAPVPDAPVETPLPFKVLLPIATNKAPDNLVLTAEQQLERFVESTQITDRVEQRRNNITYATTTRVTPDAPHKAVIAPETKQQLVNVVVQDAQKNGFKEAAVIVLGTREQIPENPLNIGATSINLGYYKGTGVDEPFFIGFFASHRIGDRVILYFAPAPNLPLNDPDILRGVNEAITRRFLSMTISGGNFIAPNALFGKQEHLNLATQQSIRIS